MDLFENKWIDSWFISFLWEVFKWVFIELLVTCLLGFVFHLNYDHPCLDF
jgi:hypothetical protein